MLTLLLIAAAVSAAVGIYAHRASEPVVEKPRPGYGVPPTDPRAEALLRRFPFLADRELLELVPKLAVCRPPTPWARGLVERALAQGGAGLRLRQLIWERFRDGRELPHAEVNWHHGSRLRLAMGSELSHGVFVVGSFDPNEFAFLEGFLQPDMVFIDGGAHEGIYSLFASLRTGPGGRVIAFEPSERECAAWRANMELNGRHATLIPTALGRTDGEAMLVLAQEQRSGHNTLGEFVWEGVQESGRVRVPVRSLDSIAEELGLARVDLLKLDIEGAETQALRGAERVLREFRPALLIEVSPRSLEAQGSSRGELLSLLDQCGYDLFSFDYWTGELIPGDSNPGGENLVARPRRSPPRDGATAA